MRELLIDGIDEGYLAGQIQLLKKLAVGS